MSRLLLSNSTVLQRAASTAAGTTQRRFAALSQTEATSARGGFFAAASKATSNYYDCRATSTSAALLANAPQTQLVNSSTTTPKRQMSTMPSKCLELRNINPNFISMEYAVRGPLVIRAGEIEQELKKGVQKPFNTVIRANIGDSHAMGQRPMTFVRQLLALTVDPSLLDSSAYPEDVKNRAREILDGCQGGSLGSYTDSAGLEVIRRQVAAFIEERDGISSDWQNIYLTAGATPGIKSVLSLICNHVDGKKPGVMVPTPQYPLYSATLAEYGMEKINYYLDEEKNWSLERDELERSLAESKKHCNPRAIVIINPGNPTGQVLSRDNIVEIVKFAYDNKLFLLADEVYQANVYAKGSKFYSFKQVMQEMGAPYKDMELASFLSTSKGFLGECGIRGGYMEILNMCPQVKAMLTKSITASLCGTSVGQVAVSALVNPPKPGELSYELYNSEKHATLKSLKERSELIYKTLSSFEGFKVNVIQGAMYVFPQIEIPPKAIEAAKAKNMAADAFYALELLESAGICIIPGSGFGQKPGTYHFRTTILPQKDLMKVMMDKFQSFHSSFMQRYK